jgi:hypothetical protein
MATAGPSKPYPHASESREIDHVDGRPGRAVALTPSGVDPVWAHALHAGEDSGP